MGMDPSPPDPPLPKDPGPEAPGGVYLCQVGDTVSCGACCGLYNVADASEASLTALLVRRTEAFSELPRTLEALLAFMERAASLESQDRPFPHFHHCPFIGLVGMRRSRVGCLLHPLAAGNEGIDFRGISHYGGLACRIYFCPAHRRVSPAAKEIIRTAAEDWYRYGLVITEARLLNAFFGAVEDRMGRPLPPADRIGSEGLDAVRGLMALRLRWPYRPPGAPLASDFFEADRRPKPPASYPEGMPPSRHDPIFRELGSRFPDVGAVRKAEAMVDGIIEGLTVKK